MAFWALAAFGFLAMLAAALLVIRSWE